MIRRTAVVLVGLATAGFFTVGTAVAAPTDSGPQGTSQGSSQGNASPAPAGNVLGSLLGGVKQTLGQGL